MSKDKSKELTAAVAGGTGALVVPDYLKGKDLGTEALANVVVPSYVKIIQKMSDDALLEKFKPGDVILSPELTLLHSGGDGKPVVFTPVFFYEEWVTRNPRGTNLPFIRSRSFDPKGEIAKLASSPDTWEEVCPEFTDKVLKHVHCYNYLVMFRGEKSPVLPSIMSFQVMESRTGRAFANLITMRQAPIYGCAFEFTTATGGKRSNDSGSWYGFDIENADEPFATADEAALYETLHKQLKEKFDSGEIKANYDAETSGAGATVQSDDAASKGF